MIRFSYVGESLNALQYLMYTISVSDVEKIVNIVCAVFTTIVLFASRIYQWYHNSKMDGRITKDEWEQGVHIVQDSVKELHDKLDDKEDKDARK